jgi:predicted transcriptional regulator
MAHRNVEQLLGRLLTDPALRRRFAEASERYLAALSQERLELSAVEVEALATTDPDSLRALAERLDRRLRKVDEQ